MKNKQKECSSEILIAKETYLINEGKKLNDPLLGPKKYWSILNRFLNKKKIPLIPPIFHDGHFVTDVRLKADLFNNFFASNGTPVVNDSELPDIYYRTNARLSEIYVNGAMVI